MRALALAAVGPVQWLDRRLLEPRADERLAGFRRFVVEFLYFGIKQARACLFAGLFFLAIFTVPRAGLWGVPRYDVLLIFALAVQGAV